METTEILNEGLCRKYRIDLDDSEIETKLEERIDEIQPTFSLQGFRAGKVPKRLIKSKFGVSLRAEVAQKCLDGAYQELLAEFEENLAVRPRTELLTNEEKNMIQGLEVYFEIRPEMPDLDFSAIEVERPVRANESEFDRDEMIEVMRALLGNYREREEDSPAQLGDLVEYDESLIINGAKDESSERTGKAVLLTLKESDEDAFVGLFVGRKKYETIETEIDVPGAVQLPADLGTGSGSREIVIRSVCELVPADDSTIFEEMDCESIDEAFEKWESYSEDTFQLQAEAVWRANLAAALTQSLRFEIPPTIHAMQTESMFGLRVYPESSIWSESKRGHLDNDDVEEPVEDAAVAMRSNSEPTTVRVTDTETTEHPPESAAEPEPTVEEQEASFGDFRNRMLNKSEGPARLGLYFNHVAYKNEISITEDELRNEVRIRVATGALAVSENEDEMRARLSRLRDELLYKKVEEFLIQLTHVSKKEYTLNELFPQYYGLLPQWYKNQYKTRPDGSAAEMATDDDSDQQSKEESSSERVAD